MRKCRACGAQKPATDFPKGRTYCKPCCKPDAVAARRAAKAKKARAATTAYNSRVRRTYGLEPEDQEAILAHQGGVCPICGGTPRDWDHNHLTGEIRGKTCRRCNRRLLTAARHNPAILRAAADYLENPPAQFVGNFVVPPSA